MNWYNRHIKIARRGWSSDELEQIKNLILQGKGFRTIAKMFGVTKNTISQLNKKHKWRETQQYRPPIEFSQEDLQNMKKMISDGVPFPKIADFYNIDKNTMYSLNKKYKWVDFDEKRVKRDKLIADFYLLPPKGKGWSAAKIQDQYGITQQGIRGALERMGLLDKYRDPSAAQKQKYRDNPDLRKEISRRMKQRFIDNPDLREEYSQRMLQQWKEWGGMEGLLLSYPTKEQAVRWLKGFVQRIYNTNSRAAFAVDKEYMKIINNHTYPDEVQQPQPV